MTKDAKLYEGRKKGEKKRINFEDRENHILEEKGLSLEMETESEGMEI